MVPEGEKDGGGAVVIGGDNLPSPVELGLTELPNIGSGTTVSMNEIINWQKIT